MVHTPEQKGVASNSLTYNLIIIEFKNNCNKTIVKIITQLNPSKQNQNQYNKVSSINNYRRTNKMSHLIETMFYRGQKPWHGLGTGVEHAPNIPEAIKLAGLDWTASKRPVFLENGIKVPECFAVVRDTDNKVLGTVGERYCITQNLEAFETFAPLIDKGLIQLETAGSIMDGSRVWVLGKVPIDCNNEVLKGDDVNLYVLLYHAHDGSLAHCLGFTPIRTVCYNTLTAALSTTNSQILKVKHTKNAKDTLNKLVEIMDAAKGEFAATIEQYKALANKTMDAKQFDAYVRIVFDIKPDDVAKRESTVLKELTPMFTQGIGTEISGVQGTAWAGYNAVTEYLTHVRGRDNENRFNANQFGVGKTLNAKALELALAVA